MIHTLYGWRQTGSVAIEAALKEAGAEYRFVPINTAKKEQRGEAYSLINPRQQLPSLIHPDGTVITEGPAILNHIADAFPEAHLAPPPASSTRALHN